MVVVQGGGLGLSRTAPTDRAPLAAQTYPKVRLNVMTATSAPDRLLRYRSIVSDWDRFLSVNQSPEPVTLRVRTLRYPVEELQARLARAGFTVTPVPGLSDYLRVEDGPHSVAQTLEHWLGWFHVQQCVMALPSLALGPEPGERVLDLCAAPGGKTAHLAELMEDRGCLVAVDPKEKRLRGLMANLFRLGHPNILVVASDGRELPRGALFDRVLVDAPCSAEGNFRRQEGRLPPRTAAFQNYITHLQESLLRRGVALARPGGTVVYSTCTFAPEENEAVLSRVLADAPVQVEPIGLDLPHAPGIPEWKGERFHPDVRHAWRVYPHHMDSGGLFMARLRRLEGPRDPEMGREGAGAQGDSAGDAEARAGWTSVPVAFPGEDPVTAQERVQVAQRLLEVEYGFDTPWIDAMGWMVRAENIWTHTVGEWPVDAWKPSGGWRVVALGLRAFREAPGGRETPSNAFLTRFARPRPPTAGEALPPRWRPLEREELDRLLQGEPLAPGNLPTGPVVLVFRDQVLGRGMVGRDGLHMEVPKAQARRLGALLEEG
jgi:NOL1/NOP2/sun family putative RNA methylase